MGKYSVAMVQQGTIQGETIGEKYRVSLLKSQVCNFNSYYKWNHVNHNWWKENVKRFCLIVCAYKTTINTTLLFNYWKNYLTLLLRYYYTIVTVIISASSSDQLWGIRHEGNIYVRKTKYLIRRQPSSDPLLKKSTSISSDEGWELVWYFTKTGLMWVESYWTLNVQEMRFKKNIWQVDVLL